MAKSNDFYIPGDVGFPPRQQMGSYGLLIDFKDEWREETEHKKAMKELIDNQIKKKANAVQEGGDHYKKRAIQPWDFIIQNNLGYLEGNIVKYVTRHKDKNGIEDLKKAQHYLQKLIETYENI